MVHVLFAVTPSNVASSKIECQNLFYVYRSRKHWECKYNFIVQSRIWLGGLDKGNEGIWKWESTGQTIQFNDFQQGQPDNSNGAENCLEIILSSTKFWWNDNNCGTKLSSVCEK